MGEFRKPCGRLWTRGKRGAKGKGRGAGSGQGDNLGQNIFHRPASSGQYAVVVNVDLYKVGRNDITLAEDLSAEERKKRAGAVLRGLTRTFVKPTGAHRNTQNPHVVDFEGVITTSEGTLPAPMVSALSGEYVEQVERIAGALNGMSGGSSLAARRFGSLAEFVEKMASIAAEMAA